MTNNILITKRGITWNGLLNKATNTTTKTGVWFPIGTNTKAYSYRAKPNFFMYVLESYISRFSNINFIHLRNLHNVMQSVVYFFC